MSVGTIFSIYQRVTPVGTVVTIDDFLQEETIQVAAGYIIYGISTMLDYTSGHWVNGFTLNPAIGTFYLSHPNMKFPKKGSIYSVNEGNYIHFPKALKTISSIVKKKRMNANIPFVILFPWFQIFIAI